jgi:hypothetical protein
MTHWREYKSPNLMQIRYRKDHKHVAARSFPLHGSERIKQNLKKVGIEL